MVNQVSAPTFWATIFVGFKNTETKKVHSIDMVRELCSKYVNDVGLCVTVTENEYIYSNDHGEGYAGEPGVMVGLINYPRFPAGPTKIREQALELARILKEALEQHRVSVLFPDETVMLGEFYDSGS